MRDIRLLFGPAALALLIFVMVVLAALVPGYDSVRQTVSEIGEAGSPMQIPFAAMLSAIGACLLVLAWGLWREAAKATRGYVGAVLVGCMAGSVTGVGVFAHPHDLHNVFGMSQLIGYQAPLAFALAWRRDPERKGVALFCWLALLVVWVSLALNLSSIWSEQIAAALEPLYGLVQRSLFLSWFAWAAGLGVMLWRRAL